MIDVYHQAAASTASYTIQYLCVIFALESLVILLGVAFTVVQISKRFSQVLIIYLEELSYMSAFYRSSVNT